MTKEDYKDSFRKPTELLQFAGLQPNHKALNVCTGFGYLAKHMAKICREPVDAQNGSEWRPFFESVGVDAAIQEMESSHQIKHFYSSMEDPAGSQRDVYDLIAIQNSFHDLYDMPVDRRKFFSSIHDALKANGKFLLVDHQAGTGRGDKDAGANRGLHRIEECVVRRELEANGFAIEATSDIYRTNIDDYMTSAWTSPMRETDRFVLLCTKVQ